MNELLWWLRQPLKPPLPQRSARADERPRGQKNELEIIADGAVARPPDFELAFVGGDDGVVEVVSVAGDFVEDGLFVPEDHRPYAGKAWRHFVDLFLYRFGIQLIVPPCLGAGAHDAHLADQDVDQLGQFIDFGLAQKPPHGQNPGIVLLGEHAAGHVGAVFQHGGELQHPKIAPTLADARLEIKNVVLARQFKANHDGDHEGKQHDDRHG